MSAVNDALTRLPALLPPPWMAAAVAGALVVGALAGFLFGRRRTRRAARQAARPPAAHQGNPAPAAHQAARPPAAPPAVDGDRVAAVVDGVIAAHDLAANSTAVRARLEQTLLVMGVHRVSAGAGTAFDPARHHVVATEPVAEGHLDRCVVREIRPGWFAGDRLVRPAEVVVWTR
jgi:hypothetical protein